MMQPHLEFPSVLRIMEVNHLVYVNYRRKRNLKIDDVCIYKKTRNTEEGRRDIYYCRLRNPDTGYFQGGKDYSIEKLSKQLKLHYPSINEPRAWAVVAQAIEAGIIRPVSKLAPDSKDLSIPLADYVEKICTYDTSPWVRYEEKRKGYRPSKKYADNMLRAFRLHAKPLISPRVTLDTFTKRDAVALQTKMDANGVSPDNISMVFKALRAAYNYAEMMDLVEYSPVQSVKPYKAERPERDILTPLEAAAMLEKLKSHIDESPTRKGMWLATRMAIHSGMREGEIRVFSISQMTRVLDDEGKPTGFYKIDVSKAWDDELKTVKPTKGRYKRTTVIAEDLAQDLLDYAEETGRTGDSLLFRATKDKGNRKSDSENAMVKNVFQDYMYEALEECGIDNETRKARGITFHSLRHLYDSEAKSIAHTIDVYKKEIRDAVGHRSKSVDELIYTHDTATSLIVKGVMSKHLLDTKKKRRIDHEAY